MWRPASDERSQRSSQSDHEASEVQSKQVGVTTHSDSKRKNWFIRLRTTLQDILGPGVDNPPDAL